MVKMNVKFDFKFPKLDFTPQLEEVADRFIYSLKKYMDMEIDINESSYPPNNPKYTAWKKKHQLSELILHATNKLRNSFYQETMGKNKVMISLSGDRKKIGDILQNQGVRNGKKFNFFGVNTRMEADGLKMMKTYLGEQLKSA